VLIRLIGKRRVCGNIESIDLGPRSVVSNWIWHCLVLSSPFGTRFSIGPGGVAWIGASCKMPRMMNIAHGIERSSSIVSYIMKRGSR
jgi:hypothetical protein